MRQRDTSRIAYRLTPYAFEVLCSIVGLTDCGRYGTYVYRVAKDVGRSHRSVGRSVGALWDRGYVQKHYKNGSDGWYITLTSQGLEACR